MSYLSPNQQRTIDERREPIRHAMDRLVERHFPEMGDDEAEEMILAMGLLCKLVTHQNRKVTSTGKLVQVESETSHIIDLDMFEDREVIRVCYDPVADVIKTVFPKQ